MTLRTLLLLSLICLAVPTQASPLNRDANLFDKDLGPTHPSTTIFGDVPTMDGLRIKSAENTLPLLPEFGPQKPITAVGIVDVDDVYNFYKHTLPPLGWQATSGRDYKKDDQLLHIRALADGKLTTVIFSLEHLSQ